MTFQVGDKITVTINSTTITAIEDTGRIGIKNVIFWLDPNHPNITITKIAPQPKAGEVWEEVHLSTGGTETVWVADDDWSTSIKGYVWCTADLDFTHARRVYASEHATPSDVPGETQGVLRLRRFKTLLGNIYTETSINSGLYHSEGSAQGDYRNSDRAYTQADLHQHFGTLEKLEAVPLVPIKRVGRTDL